MSSLFAEYEPQSPHPRLPATWVVREAKQGDAVALSRLSAERQGIPVEDALRGLEREFQQIEDGVARALWVAEDADELLGFSRTSRFDRPGDASARTAPAGWYLGGQVVAPGHRRRGIGRSMTECRLGWLTGRAVECFAIVSALNRPSLDLLAGFGFRERTRDFEFPGVTFTGGVGVLLERDVEASRT